MVQIMEKGSPSFVPEQRPGKQEQIENGERVIQVILADEHLLMREALQRVTESLPQVRVSASLSRLQDLLGVLRGGVGDVLILGSSITTSDCLECINIAHQTRASLGMVVIRQHLRPETAFPMIRSGIQALLGEDASAKDLAQAIVAATSGSTFLSQRAREILDGSGSRIPQHFTEREIQILSLLRQGLSNFDMARLLDLKEKTVEKHLTHIYQKLHIRSRTEAMLRIQALHI